MEIILIVIYIFVGAVLAALSSNGWGLVVFLASLILSPIVGFILMLVSWVVGSSKKA